MALSSITIPPYGFEGGLNADEVSPETIAACFSEEFGPFTEITDAGDGEHVFAKGQRGSFVISWSVVMDDDDEVMDNELEIFSQATESSRKEKVKALVERLLSPKSRS